MDSAALAEKLLNDMLKATEAFNKLKKINDDLKKQVGSEGQYVSAITDFDPFSYSRSHSSRRTRGS